MVDINEYGEEHMSEYNPSLQEGEELDSYYENQEQEPEQQFEEEFEITPIEQDDDQEDSFWDNMLSEMSKSPAILIPFIDSMKSDSLLWMNEIHEIEKTYDQIEKEEEKLIPIRNNINYQTLVLSEYSKNIQQHLGILDKTHIELVDEYNDLKKCDQELMVELTELQDPVQHYMERADSAKPLSQKLNFMEEQNKEFQHKNRNLEESILNLEEKLNEMKALKVDIQNGNAELRSHVEQMTENLMNVEKCIQNKETEINSLKVAEQHMKFENYLLKQSMQNQIEELQTAVNVKHEEINKFKNQHKNLVAQLYQEVQDAKQIADDYCEKSTRSLNQVDILQLEKSTLKSSNTALQKTNEELVQLLQNIEREYRSRNDTFERASSVASDNENDIKELQQKLKDLQTQEKQSKIEMERAKQESLNLINGIQSKQKRINEESMMISENQKQVERLNVLLQTQKDSMKNSMPPPQIPVFHQPTESQNQQLFPLGTKIDTPKFDRNYFTAKTENQLGKKYDTPKFDKNYFTAKILTPNKLNQPKDTINIQNNMKHSQTKQSQKPVGFIEPDQCKGGDNFLDDLPSLDDIINDDPDSDESSSSYFAKPKRVPFTKK